MTRERASIFAGDEALHVSAFAPKAGLETNVVPVELVRGTSEAFRFPSREANVAGTAWRLGVRAPKR